MQNSVESGAAYPETDKLLYLSQLFDVSVDYLITDGLEEHPVESDAAPKRPSIDYSSSIGSWCNIDLCGWDSGYDKAFIAGQGTEYIVFYQADRKKNLKLGMVWKKHIDSIATLSKSVKLPAAPTQPFTLRENPFSVFVGKTCDIQMHSPNLSSFVLSNDGYQNVLIQSATSTSIEIEDGKSTQTIPSDNIAGLVES